MKDFWINLRCLSQIYLKCFSQTLVISKRYWWVLFTTFFYVFLMGAVALMASSLGRASGLIVGLAMDACISSFLVTVESMIRKQKISLDSFKKSFWIYFFDVMGVFFVYWILSFVVITPLERSGLAWAALGLRWTFIIFFNPVPELIYIAGVRSFGFFSTELFSKAYEFIRDNWLEWYVPNILVMVFLYLLLSIPWPLPGLLGQLVSALLFAFSIYFIMIFRGLLFEALYRSSRRKRLFEYRAGHYTV